MRKCVCITYISIHQIRIYLCVCALKASGFVTGLELDNVEMQ